jgi:hypothetical protein
MNGRTTMQWRRLFLLLTTGLFAVGTIGGCSQRAHVPINLLKKGMNVQQVEKILGEPLKVYGPVRIEPNDPILEIRWYQGNGDHKIAVTFRDGSVSDFHEEVPKREWIKVG